MQLFLHPYSSPLLWSMPGRVGGKDGTGLGWARGFSLLPSKELKDQGPSPCLPLAKNPPSSQGRSYFPVVTVSSLLPLDSDWLPLALPEASLGL